MSRVESIRTAISRRLSRLKFFDQVTAGVQGRPLLLRKLLAYARWWLKYHHELVYGRSAFYRRFVTGLRLPRALAVQGRKLIEYRKFLRAAGGGSQPERGNRIVVMLVISDLRIDPRVLRASQRLVAAGYRVKIIFPDVLNPPFAESPLDWGKGIEFCPLGWQAASFMSVFPGLIGEELLASALEERPYAYHCHDLNTSLAGLRAARTVGAYCVCDFHEWFSENVSWNARRKLYRRHSLPQRLAYRLAERWVMQHADAVVTVCDSIADELRANFADRPVHVIRNIPPLTSDVPPHDSLKAKLGLPADRFLLLWQGGTGPTRLLEPIIEALARLPKVTFVIRGPSLDLFGEGYRRLAERVGAADRLILLPPVPSAEVVVAANGADAGIWTLPNLSKNFYYALPNKIFEYMAAGLPVLAANFPEARKLVEGNGIGLCFDPYDPASIARQVGRLAEEPGLAQRFRAALPAALERMQADREWDRLVEVYESLPEARARVVPARAAA